MLQGSCIAATIATLRGDRLDAIRVFEDRNPVIASNIKLKTDHAILNDDFCRYISLFNIFFTTVFFIYLFTDIGIII